MEERCSNSSGNAGNVAVATQFNHCLFVFGVARQLRASRHGDGGGKVVYNKHALPHYMLHSHMQSRAQKFGK